MRLTYPIFYVMIASVGVILFSYFFGAFMPGDGDDMAELYRFFGFLGGSFIVLPSIAFMVAGRQVRIQQLALASLLMGVLQTLALALTIYTVLRISYIHMLQLWILVMILGVPILSTVITLALTGNLKPSTTSK